MDSLILGLAEGINWLHDKPFLIGHGFVFVKQTTRSETFHQLTVGCLFTLLVGLKLCFGGWASQRHTISIVRCFIGLGLQNFLIMGLV